MQVPSWWLTVSGIYFIFATLALVISCFALMMAIRAIRELSARMQTMSTKVEEAIGEVRQITRNVGGSVSSITNRVDAFTAGATKKLEIFSTILMLLSTVKKMGLFQKPPKSHEEKD